MARKSSIERLPNEVRAELEQKIDDNQESIIDLVAWIEHEHGAIISKSAMGRFVQRRKRRAAAVRLMADVSSELGEEGNDEAVELMMQLAQIRVQEARIIERLKGIGAI